MTIQTTTWWTDRRVRWSILAAAVLLLAYVELLWIDAFPWGHLHTGDTDHLVKGARTALDCIGDGIWLSCGHVKGSPNSGVFHYSMLQYLPAAFFLALGASEAATLELLARMSVVAFAGSFLLIWSALRHQPRLAALGCLALLGSAATYHATSSFSEMLAGMLFLAAIVAAGTRRPILILLVFWIATLGKETFPPFLLLFGMLAGRDEEDGLLPPARTLLPIIGGVGLGVASFTAFNYFRFSSPWNLTSIQPELVTPTWPLRLEFLAAQWFSPAAGILWFWPVAMTVLIASAVVGVLHVIRKPEAFANWLPVMALLSGMLAFTAGLSLWFSPFGWISYGPRLAAPLLPAAVVVCLRTVGPEILRFIDRVARKTTLVAALWLALMLVMWPQLGSPWTWHPGIQALMAPTEDCDDSVAVYEGDHFYDCVTSFMWRTSPWVIHRVATTTANGATTGRLMGAAAGTMLVVVIVRPRVGDRRDEPAITSAHQNANET
jgi:hypothetical protein